MNLIRVCRTAYTVEPTITYAKAGYPQEVVPPASPPRPPRGFGCVGFGVYGVVSFDRIAIKPTVTYTMTDHLQEVPPSPGIEYVMTENS